jgi:demethylmenaquinone methyltransferase / 2-methoxy-6-polyprenyl-1,4-benzoquinol methylase
LAWVLSLRPVSALPPPADKPRFVAAMFDRIARRYDLMNTLMTGGRDRAWRRLVARHAVDPSKNAAPRVLDVGTGTGKLAQAILEVAPAANVIGVDFSQAMLRAAPRRLRLAGADALRLPFEDGRFDAVVSAFVLRNLADVARGVAEQTRVLRPGGRLVVLETTPGARGLWGPLFRVYFRRVVPLLGGLIARDASAYTYLPESTLAFLEPARLAHVLLCTGLVEIEVSRLALGSVGLTLGTKPSDMLAHTGGAA